MAVSRSKHVRLFRSAAAARLTEADALRAGGLTLGAVYLAGYAVECVLKALILSLLDEHEQPDMIAEFRGSRAHDYGRLRTTYRELGGAAAPKTVSAALSAVGTWGTHLRYLPRADYPGDATAFFAAVELVLEWAHQRL